MKERRESKETDQQQTQKAYDLILDLIQKHSEIEPTLWIGAMFSVLANGYKNSNFSYDEFCQEINNVSKHYKSCWE